MKRLSPILGFLYLLVSVAHAQPQPVTLRLAGDEWFLKSLTKTKMISVFERQTGIHVDVVFKNDNAIMTDLDHSAGAAGPAYDIIVVRHRFLGAAGREEGSAAYRFLPLGSHAT
jgi:maltose-binding protein MalE